MNEDKSRVDKLSDSLYSRTLYQNPLDKRSVVKELETPEVGDKWQGQELDEILARERIPNETHPLMKKFFIFALVFFIGTVVVGGFVFFGGVNFVSSKNVDINIVGPTLASAGQAFELGVTVENNNNTDLETASLSIQYPQGARDPNDTSKTLTYSREELGVINAGAELVRNVGVVLLGSTGEVKEFKLSVEYKVKGSNATFYKEKVYDITIGNAPVTLKISSPGRVTSGETFTTSILLTLNSTEILKNVLLRAEYPYGYSFVGSTPDTASDNNLWSLGDISPGVTKKIDVRGKLVGENQDERTLRFYVGVSDNDNASSNFKTVILSDQETIGIERPDIGLTALFNGENVSTYVAPAGRDISASLRFQNNLSYKLLNPKLEVILSGVALNKSSLIAQNNGSYNSSSNRISWNLVNNQGLSELSPGDGGAVSFNFSALPESALSGGNQEIGIQMILTGTPVGSAQAVSVTENRTVKIASQVTLSSYATFSTGSFVNEGLIPPQVGATTTYSVIWSVVNTQSDISGARVTARLGQNVKWLSAKDVTGENVSYDENSNTVTWDMGVLSSDSGFSSHAREVTFQVALVPLLSQVGTTPSLVNNIIFSGVDNSLGKTITVNNPAITTKLTKDPAFIQGDDIVVKQ